MINFGFTIRDEYNYDKDKTVPNKYTLCLPHQCDQWEIVTGTKEECLKELDLFISEAKELRKKLKELKND